MSEKTIAHAHVKDGSFTLPLKELFSEKESKAIMEDLRNGQKKDPDGKIPVHIEYLPNNKISMKRA